MRARLLARSDIFSKHTILGSARGKRRNSLFSCANERTNGRIPAGGWGWWVLVSRMWGQRLGRRLSDAVIILGGHDQPHNGAPLPESQCKSHPLAASIDMSSLVVPTWLSSRSTDLERRRAFSTNLGCVSSSCHLHSEYEREFAHKSRSIMFLDFLAGFYGLCKTQEFVGLVVLMQAWTKCEHPRTIYSTPDGFGNRCASHFDTPIVSETPGYLNTSVSFILCLKIEERIRSIQSRGSLLTPIPLLHFQRQFHCGPAIGLWSQSKNYARGSGRRNASEENVGRGREKNCTKKNDKQRFIETLTEPTRNPPPTLPKNNERLPSREAIASSKTRTNATKFQHVNKNAITIELAVRGHGGLQECWSFFSSQPVPTPQTWWRYSSKTESNQHIIDKLPSVAAGSDLPIHHFARTATLALEEPRGLGVETHS